MQVSPSAATRITDGGRLSRQPGCRAFSLEATRPNLGGVLLRRVGRCPQVAIHNKKMSTGVASSNSEQAGLAVSPYAACRNTQ